MNTHTKDEIALNIEAAIQDILRIEKTLAKIELDIPTQHSANVRNYLLLAIEELTLAHSQLKSE